MFWGVLFLFFFFLFLFYFICYTSVGLVFAIILNVIGSIGWNLWESIDPYPSISLKYECGLHPRSKYIILNLGNTQRPRVYACTSEACKLHADQSSRLLMLPYHGLRIYPKPPLWGNQNKAADDTQSMGIIAIKPRFISNQSGRMLKIRSTTTGTIKETNHGPHALIKT